MSAAEVGEVEPTREEWAVRHAQGVFTGYHGGSLTEVEARRWAADNVAQDARRRWESRGKTRLLRRRVTEWQEVDE